MCVCVCLGRCNVFTAGLSLVRKTSQHALVQLPCGRVWLGEKFIHNNGCVPTQRGHTHTPLVHHYWLTESWQPLPGSCTQVASFRLRFPFQAIVPQTAPHFNELNADWCVCVCVCCRDICALMPLTCQDVTKMEQGEESKGFSGDKIRKKSCRVELCEAGECYPGTPDGMFSESFGFRDGKT